MKAVSWMGFEWRVALRFLAEGRRQTALIVVGVAAGVAVVAYISALVSGLQANTLAKTLGTQAHITIRVPDDQPTAPSAKDPPLDRLGAVQVRAQRVRSILQWQAIQSSLEADEDVVAVSPMVSGSALALRADASQAVALLGVELDRYDRIVGIRNRVTSGQARLQPGDIVIGVELAHDLGVGIGDRLSLQAGAVTQDLRVTAVVDLGVRDLNRRTAIIALRAAQSLLGVAGGATQLDVRVRDVWASRQTAARLRARLPAKVEAWQETNAQLVSALEAQSMSTALIRAVVLVVVVLGIASVLVVSVVQKRREIGILRAMGATRGQVQRMFLLQGAMVGLAGSALGLILAIGMIALFTTFVRGADNLPLFPIRLDAGTAWRVAGMALACGVLAAIAPARSAARLDPAQAIRL